jgi:hypothetical protein
VGGRASAVAGGRGGVRAGGEPRRLTGAIDHLDERLSYCR